MVVFASRFYDATMVVGIGPEISQSIKDIYVAANVGPIVFCSMIPFNTT